MTVRTGMTTGRASHSFPDNWQWPWSRLEKWYCRALTFWFAKLYEHLETFGHSFLQSVWVYFLRHGQSEQKSLSWSFGVCGWHPKGFCLLLQERRLLGLVCIALQDLFKKDLEECPWFDLPSRECFPALLGFFQTFQQWGYGIQEDQAGTWEAAAWNSSFEFQPAPWWWVLRYGWPAGEDCLFHVQRFENFSMQVCHLHEKSKYFWEGNCWWSLATPGGYWCGFWSGGYFRKATKAWKIESGQVAWETSKASVHFQEGVAKESFWSQQPCKEHQGASCGCFLWTPQ